MYLGTGSGKTYIAVKLIQSYREKLRQGKKAIFLVSSVPLVDQQKREIENTTAMNVGSYCGADGVDDWGQEEWNKQLEMRGDLFATSCFHMSCVTEGVMD